MNHATERSLEGALAELKALRLAYGAAQRRCTASLQRLHARNQVLEEEVLQLRAQLAARDVAMAWTQQAALSAQGEALQPGRPQMVGWIEALMQRLQTLLRSLRNPAGSHVAVFGAPQGTQGSGGDAAGAASGQSPGVSVGSPAARSPERGSEGPAGHPAEEEGDTSGASSGLQEAVQPAGRQAALSARVLSPAQGAPSAQAAPSTARPEGALSPTDAAHDADSSQAEDDFIDPPDLEERLVEADLVICQTGCLSHQAYWRVQDHCRRHNKPCVLVAEPDALRIIRIHQRDETAPSGEPAQAPAAAGADREAVALSDGQTVSGD